MNSPSAIRALLSLSIFLLVVLGARAAGDATPAGAIGVLASDPSGTRLEVRSGEPRFLPVGAEKAEKGEKGEKGERGEKKNREQSPVRVEIDGFVAMSPPGAPDLPGQTVLVAIPAGSRADIRVAITDERTYPGIRVAPVPVPGPRPEGTELPTWIRQEDPTFYGETYPAERVSMSKPMQIGDLEVVGITVYPAVYDPAAAAVHIAGRIQVTVVTSGGTVLPEPVTSVFDVPGKEGRAAFALGHVVNRDAAQRFFKPRSEPPAPAVPVGPGGVGPGGVGPGGVGPGGVGPGGVGRGGGASFRSSSNWVKVFVGARGLVRLDGARLQVAGVNPSGIDPATLRLFWGGGLDPESGLSPRSPLSPQFMEECAIQVVGGGDGRFDLSDSILFLGQGASGWLDDFGSGAPYAIEFREHSKVDRGVYWLTWGGDFPGAPQRMATQPAPPDPLAPVANRGLARIHSERNQRYLADLYERGQYWERWWWQLLSAPDARVFYPVNPAKPDLTQLGSLRLRLWGYTSAAALPQHDHNARVWFNSVPILDPADGDSVFTWDGPDYPRPGFEYLTSGRQDVTSNQVTLRNGQNLVEVDILPGQLDQVMVAWFDLGYVRHLDLTGEPGAEVLPTGASGPATVEVTGAPNGARIFDVTNSRIPVELTGFEQIGSTVRFAANLDPAAPAKFLVGVSPSSPVAIEIDRSLSDLRNPAQSAWYVVIAHDSMIEEAIRLAEAHAQVPPPDGALPGVPIAVRASDVYDEFGWGLKSEVAIRNFIDYAFHSWAAGPAYVCLLGDASFDPKDIFGGGRRDTDLVPAPGYWNWIGGTYLGSDYLSDDFYVRTFGSALETPPDPATDLVIGRLPAGDIEEARIMVDEKSIPYLTVPEYGPWRQRVILAADDELAGQPPGTEWFHTHNTERIEAVLPPELEPVKVYLIHYPREPSGVKPAGRAAFIQAFDEGAAFVNYIGHGAPDVLAHEALFRVENVGQLQNGRRLPFFSTFSCTVNRFDQPGTEGIGEALVAHSGGGSVGSLGSTDLAFVFANQVLNEGTYTRFFNQGDFTRPQSLGNSAAQTKNLLAAAGDTAGARKYAFLGDPALGPTTPSFRLGVDFPAAGGGDTTRLVAGIPYDLTAAISAAEIPPPPWSAQVTANDSEESRLLPGTSPPDFYSVPASAFFRSTLDVEDDTLAARLVVPIDATQSLTPGRGVGEVRIYAVGQGGWDALGWKPIFLDVFNASSSEPEPVDAPQIVASFPGEAHTVAPGATLTIRIEDKSGINIVGNTPANSVFMRIDETRTVALNDIFAYEPGSATRGTVTYTLPGLETGPHVARIFASDNYLNRGEAELPFTVADGQAATIVRADLFPNPLRDGYGGTVISFELSEPAEVTVRIYAVSGKLVRSDFPGLQGEVGAGIQQIHWDGRDEDGDLVGNGVYLCSISARGRVSSTQASALLRALVSR
jgi:hypothetical protein